MTTPRCRSAPTARVRLLGGLLLGAATLAMATPAPARTASDPFAAFDRVRALLEDPGGPAGDLPVECTVQLDPEASGGRVSLPIEILLDLRGLDAAPERVRVTLAAATIEGELATFQETVVTGDLGETELWLYRGRLELADEVHAAAAVAETLGGGGWGGCSARLTDGPMTPPAGLRVAVHDPAAGADGAEPSTGERGRGAQDRPASSASSDEPSMPSMALPDRASRLRGGAEQDGAGDRVIVLLPPKDRPARGRTGIDTMVTTELARSAVFYLNGEEVATDGRPPFSATLDLGEEVVPHTVRVVARDRSGVPLGEHEITLNERSAPFDVAITQVRPTATGEPGGVPGAGAVRIEAQVSIPPGESLERLEIYRNDELIETLEEPPWTARLALPGGQAEPGPSDYVRVLAVLANGDSLEDVRLLAAGTPSDRVEVNLVELFAVVTNPDGAPVEGLGPEDFRITWRGERREVERFQVADDVPLTLGLLVDTSGSMDVLMVDAKKAAGRFLLQTLIEGDRAFLVDFDDRARLLQAPTGDTSALIAAFNRLSPGGFTALYDSIVFALAQIQETDGRRAVVLVTDGYDEGSRFSTRRAIGDAKRLAVPVYVISLAGLYNERGTVRRADLEAITGHTGGRTYYIREIDELGTAYDEINRELRSQYVLAFGTERFLTEEELDDVELEVLRDGLEVRWTAGSTR